MSISPLYSQISGFIKTLKWHKLDDMIKDEKLEYKVDHDKKKNNYLNYINTVIEYLGKDKNVINNIIKEIKKYKCKIYCENKNQDNCITRCTDEINRYDILLSLLFTYILIYDKLNYNNIIKQIDEEIKEIENDIEVMTKHNKREIYNKYLDSIKFIYENKLIDESAFNVQILEKIKENKIKYKTHITKNYYDDCIKSIKDVNIKDYNIKYVNIEDDSSIKSIIKNVSMNSCII